MTATADIVSSKDGIGRLACNVVSRSLGHAFLG